MISSKKVAIFLLALNVASGLFICCGIVYFVSKAEYYAQGGGREEIISDEEGVYVIDSQTLLQDLRLNKTDVFEYLPDGKLIMSPETNLPPVSWTESDWLFVAKSFNQYVFNESLEGWQYDSIDYGMDCDEIVYGPQWAIFSLVRHVSSDGNKVRLERALLIYPDENRVGWYETGYEDIYSHPTFTLDQVKLPLQTVQQIAEENGGKKFRTSVENNCLIFFEVNAANNADWQVRYHQGVFNYESGRYNEFIINIDQETGGYKVVDP